MLQKTLLSEAETEVITSTLFMRGNYHALAKRLEADIPGTRFEVEEPSLGSSTWHLHCQHGPHLAALVFEEMSTQIEVYVLASDGKSVEFAIVSDNLSEVKTFLRNSFDE